MQIRNLNGYSNTITKSLQKIAIFWCSVSGRQHGGAIVKFIECYQWIPIAVERVEVRNGANILLIASSNTNLWTIRFRVHYLETWCPKKKSIFFLRHTSFWPIQLLDRSKKFDVQFLLHKTAECNDLKQEENELLLVR